MNSKETIKFDELLLIGGGQQIFGWQSISLTRGIERCPTTFELTMTERFPGETDFLLKAGDECSLYIGQLHYSRATDPIDLLGVLVGYVDRVAMAIPGGIHTVTVTGRGRCADLVDCAAIWKSCQF